MDKIMEESEKGIIYLMLLFNLFVVNYFKINITLGFKLVRAFNFITLFIIT